MNNHRTDEPFVLSHASIAAFEKQARLERNRYMASLIRAGFGRLRAMAARLPEAISARGEAREA
ncbi:hypothetical protein [Aquisalimonas asiatica]|uniref:Uncharacterized protein n=1 Tax=Aquisalimonas asiatica TaxID=406100 RepID=A0A1H8V0U0_9GAMM|nr:hypothetical protein [Aquisalimonas asiatica]SEP09015.1 hypothetical protein SAMN04488052_10941 [Aquisalimonas asiatica]